MIAMMVRRPAPKAEATTMQADSKTRCDCWRMFLFILLICILVEFKNFVVDFIG